MILTATGPTGFKNRLKNKAGIVFPAFLHGKKAGIAYDKSKAGGISMDGKKRSDVKPGLEVNIVLKQDQRTGKKTRGIVKDLLTNSPTHPHGIKVRLEDGQVGRVCEILNTGK
jgi:uncharacterized repeat protein (TIGR03833 family)